jgi:hypothetical protein
LLNSSRGSFKRLKAARRWLSSKKETWYDFIKKILSNKRAIYMMERGLLFLKLPFINSLKIAAQHHIFSEL